MTRKVAYILLTKNGPPQDKQEQAIAARGFKAAVSYEDDMTSRRRKTDTQFVNRAWMLRHMRGGETIAVASPGRLGIGKDDVLSVLQAIELKGGEVFDASTGTKLRWAPEIAAAASFIDRAVVEHKVMAAAAARAAKKAQGEPGGAPIKPLKLPEAEIRRRWFNQADNPSRFAIAKAAGVSARTLAKRFGPRGGIAKAKKGTSND